MLTCKWRHINPLGLHLFCIAYIAYCYIFLIVICCANYKLLIPLSVSVNDTDRDHGTGGVTVLQTHEEVEKFECSVKLHFWTASITEVPNVTGDSLESHVTLARSYMFIVTLKSAPNENSG